MKNSIQKTTILLVAISSILLASGNVLMAADRQSGDLITAADLAFVKASPQGIVTPVTPAGQIQPGGMITASDYAFVAQPFAESSGDRQANGSLETAGIITAADYKFLTTGQVADVFSAYSDLEDSLAGRLSE
jgi:hypothetical protein